MLGGLFVGSYDRVAEIKRAALPRRLATGAGYLGGFWRDGIRCLGGWRMRCPCEKKNDFCQTKARWIELLLELHGEWPYGVDPSSPFAVIEAMTLSQFDATGLTMLVEIPPARKPIRIGPRGTSWDTVRDLMSYTFPSEHLAEALEAVVKIQSVM